MKIEFPYCTCDVRLAIEENRLIKTWEDKKNIYFMIRRNTVGDKC